MKAVAHASHDGFDRDQYVAHHLRDVATALDFTSGDGHTKGSSTATTRWTCGNPSAGRTRGRSTQPSLCDRLSSTWSGGSILLLRANSWSRSRDDQARHFGCVIGDNVRLENEDDEGARGSEQQELQDLGEEYRSGPPSAVLMRGGPALAERPAVSATTPIACSAPGRDLLALISSVSPSLSTLGCSCVNRVWCWGRFLVFALSLLYWLGRVSEHHHIPSCLSQKAPCQAVTSHPTLSRCAPSCLQSLALVGDQPMRSRPIMIPSFAPMWDVSRKRQVQLLQPPQRFITMCQRYIILSWHCLLLTPTLRFLPSSVAIEIQPLCATRLLRTFSK